MLRQENARASALERQLQVQETKSKVSPLYLDSTPQDVYAAPASSRPGSARAKQLTRSGWPVHYSYFEKHRRAREVKV